jgi:hypothetical protein
MRSTALLALVLSANAWLCTAGAVEVGVSVEMSQPGVYGRVDIGRFPRAVLLPPPQVVVVQRPRPVVYEDVYVWAPPGRQRRWHRHEKRYDDDCAERERFVHQASYRSATRRGDFEPWRYDGRRYDGGHRGSRRHGRERDRY